jgi:ribosomal protein L34
LEKPKIFGARRKNSTPHPKKTFGFLYRATTSNGRGIPTLLPSDIFISLSKLKTMKMKIEGSVYQSNGAGMGMPVQDGRLVNNRPDGMTGIQQVAMARKAMKHEAKVNTYAEGSARGNRMVEMDNMMISMMSSKGCSCGKPNCNC